MLQVLKTYDLCNLAIGFRALSDRRHRHGDRRAPFGCHRRAHLARGAAAVPVRRCLRLVSPCRAAFACHACLVDRHPRHLRSHRNVLVAADLDPDRHRCCGGARADQLHRQLRRFCRAGHRRSVEGGHPATSPLPYCSSPARLPWPERLHSISARASGVEAPRARHSQFWPTAQALAGTPTPGLMRISL